MYSFIMKLCDGMSLTRIEGCDHDNVFNKLQVKIWALYILVK